MIDPKQPVLGAELEAKFENVLVRTPENGVPPRWHWEIREALGLIDEARYMELFRKYVVHVSHALERERLFDPHTGELTDPDEKFMRGLEKTMAPDAGPGLLLASARGLPQEAEGRRA